VSPFDQATLVARAVGYRSKVLFIPSSNQPCSVLLAIEPLAEPESSDAEALENWPRLPET
jgi:hypothetical protein